MNTFIIVSLLGIIIPIPFVIIYGIYVVYINKIFHSYLRKNHFERWREVTRFRKSSVAGGADPIKWINYVNGHEDDEIETIAIYKKKLKSGMRKLFYSLLPWSISLLCFWFLTK